MGTLSILSSLLTMLPDGHPNSEGGLKYVSVRREE